MILKYANLEKETYVSADLKCPASGVATLAHQPCWVAADFLLYFSSSSSVLRVSLKLIDSIQGYLTHKQTPTPRGPPWDPQRTLGMGLRQSPRGVRFLMSEVLL